MDTHKLDQFTFQIIGVRNSVRVYFAFALMLLASGIFRPRLNWDLIPYVASAISIGTTNPLEVHSIAYSEVAKVQVEKSNNFSELEGDSKFRKTMKDDPTQFTQILPLYQVRLLYVCAIYLLYHLGMNVVFATHFISAICAFVTVGIIYSASKDACVDALRIVLLPLAFALGALETARLSTPDAMIMMVILLIGHQFLRKRQSVLLVLPVLVLIKPDLLIFVLLLACSLLYLQHFRMTFVLLSVGTALLAVIALNRYFGYPPLANVFAFTLIDRTLLSEPTGSLTFALYSKALIVGLASTIANPSFLLYCTLLSGVLLLIGFERSRWSAALRTENIHLIFVSAGYVLIHLILLPLSEVRLFVGCYIATAIALFRMITSEFRSTISTS